MSADALHDQMQALTGREVGPFHSWDEINVPMARHWCEALGIDAPCFVDAQRAALSRHGALVAPATMLQVWTMNGLRGELPPGSTEAPAYQVFEAIQAAGYPAIVAVNTRQEYLRYLRPGDRLHRSTQIESVSPRKETALGTGYFVTERVRFFDQRDEPVGSMRFRVFLYRAPERTQALPTPSGATPRAHNPGAVADADNTAIGARLAPLAIPITTTGIVAGAIATRDFQNIHHDAAAARALGSPDIFMNLLSSCGLVERFALERYGCDVLLRDIDIRLGVPNYPGDTLTISAVVSESTDAGDLKLALTGRNSLGDHIIGSVRLTP